jgi:hypothetical protein
MQSRFLPAALYEKQAHWAGGSQPPAPFFIPIALVDAVGDPVRCHLPGERAHPIAL